ncbi:hypothetical protein L873DRAFT_591827 [Choiromyces venosus 120613-1]|uniref:Uncharacterized protein n=1 Tax=Choiromyces venosus 120613-1 TaxID=1336337 RepID=A0A3N4IY64_9PEZI|nr:hypothetical protein L873DRAFT_591827 [Choiromyces venosus 120613-1]
MPRTHFHIHPQTPLPIILPQFINSSIPSLILFIFSFTLSLSKSSSVATPFPFSLCLPSASLSSFAILFDRLTHNPLHYLCKTNQLDNLTYLSPRSHGGIVCELCCSDVF